MALSKPNFVTFRTGGLECLYAVDANPINGCPMLSSAPPRCREGPEVSFSRAAPLAAWVDPPNKGLMCIVPSGMILVFGPQWDQIWPPGSYGAATAFLLATTNVMIHFRPNGKVTVVGVIMDPHVASAFYPALAGNAILVVGVAVANATLFGPQGWPVLDKPQRPDCCSPMDTIIPQRSGASKARVAPGRAAPLPPGVVTTGMAGMANDCNHFDTNGDSFQGDPVQSFFSLHDDAIGPLWNRASVVLTCMVNDFEVRVAAGLLGAQGGHGENAIRDLGLSDVAFDLRTGKPKHPPVVQQFTDAVKARPVELPLRFALARCAQRLARADQTPGLFSGTIRSGLSNVLVTIGSFISERAHDYYEDAHAPIAWDLANATKIATMKTLGGADVFPSSAAVGRAVAAKILSERGALMTWGGRNFAEESE